MAKSMRSKWKRKCRAVKRVRYGQKEADRLKKIISNDPLNRPGDEAVNPIDEVVIVVDKEKINKNAKVIDKSGNEEDMECDTKERIYNPKTMKDQYGAYPIWMNKKKIRKQKEKSKKRKVASRN